MRNEAAIFWNNCGPSLPGTIKIQCKKNEPESCTRLKNVVQKYLNQKDRTASGAPVRRKGNERSKSEDRKQGDCNPWLVEGHCSKGDCSEERTPHRTHMTRHRRPFSSVSAHVTGVHQECVEHSSLRFLERHLVATCFVVTCLVFVIPFPPFSVHATSYTALTADGNRKYLPDQRGGPLFGRMGEQSTLTDYEPKSLIEVSREHTPINFLQRRTASTPTSMTLLPQSQPPKPLGQFTSPLFTQEREVSANPFGVSDFQQAAPSGS